MEKGLMYTQLIREKTTYRYHTIGIDNCLVKTNFSTILPSIFAENRYEMMYDTLSFTYSDKQTDISLDNIISSLIIEDRLLSMEKEEDILKLISTFPFLRTPIPQQEFEEVSSLIIKEYFEMDINYFIDPSWHFIEATYYFNSPSSVMIGVKFKEASWGLDWQPYI